MLECRVSDVGTWEISDQQVLNLKFIFHYPAYWSISLARGCSNKLCFPYSLENLEFQKAVIFLGIIEWDEILWNYNFGNLELLERLL